MNAPQDASNAPPPKVDPETLALRGKAPRIIRFKRGVIIAIAAMGALAIVGVTWTALKPATFKLIADTETQIHAANKRPPEVLAGGPKSYADIPKLGPPLPGDLGKPILDAQRKMASEKPPSSTADQESLNAAQAAEAERQRREAELRKVREAGVMLPLQRAGSVTASAAVPVPVPVNEAALPAGTNPRGLDPERDPNAQGRKIDFVKTAGSSENINRHPLQPSPSPWILSAGSIVAASLITGVNSDLPGLVTAQVTENVTDSMTGRTILIPQGSRLIGEYDSVIAFGQSRALLVWQRIIFPDGSSIQIDNAPTSDASGYAGLADTVDNHSWKLLKGIALSTMLGVGTELTFGDSESDLVRALREPMSVVSKPCAGSWAMWGAKQTGAGSSSQTICRRPQTMPHFGLATSR